MKITSVLMAILLLFAIAARPAHADDVCSLSVDYSSVPVGQAFSFYVYNQGHVWPGPTPPGGNPGPPFTVKFHGTKDGIADIAPAGEVYPLTFTTLGLWSLPGYFNPGGIAGTYVRYAEIYAGNYPNYLYCVTNTVVVVLQ